jgi:dephospho-CoA kinase
MQLLALTGGVGMGKSTTTGFLRTRKIPVADTDLIARQLVEPGQPGLDEIQKLFGDEVIDAAGRLDRAKLARMVFGDAARRRQLESVLHPRIRGVWQQQVEDWSRENRPLAIVVIPLLFETDAAPLFDAVICVACSNQSQRLRLRQRGWSDEEVQQRIDAQWPIEKKLAQADFVIWTESSTSVHEAQLTRVLDSVQASVSDAR